MRHFARAYIIVAVACVLAPNNANARNGWVHLNPLSWELEFEYDGFREQSEGLYEVNQNQFSEKLKLHQSGFLVSQKILDFSVGLTPTFLQGQSTSALGEERTEAISFDYEVDLTALRDAKAPVYFEAAASRNRATYSSNLGNRIELVREARSVVMGWKLPAFPMTLSYEESLNDQTHNSGRSAAPRRRDEFQQSIRWDARSSRLQMNVEKRKFDDRIGDNNYDLLQQSVMHNLHWGKNSHLTTRQRYFNREGIHTFKQLTISERLRLQHLDRLYSSINYDYSSTVQDGDTRIHSGDYALNYWPTDELKVALSGEGRNIELKTGSEIVYGGGLKLAYQKDFFWGGALNLSLDASSERTDRESNGTTFDFLNVAFSIPVTLLVLLDTRAIDTGSIIVTDSSSSQVFLEGVDYIVQALTGERVELQILTSGLIAAGDTVLISYSAAAQPSAEFIADSVSSNISLNFDRIRFYHSFLFRDETLQSGSLGEGQSDLRDQTTGVEVNWSEAWFKASARAEIHSHKSGDFSTESVAFIETAEFDVSASMHLALSASQISYESSGRKTDLSQWDVHLDWALLRGMSAMPYVSGWNRQDDLGRDEQRLSTGIKWTWKLRKVELDLDISHREIAIQDRDRMEERIGVRIVRRSR